ncbi:hypothetical protein CSUI_007429 [Cystoisospora suis]|uniref:Uncharacterized protein n=1 Tax=Cystoisospora suis TaxID=483139 RepID=A0A2C6KQG8_9APIC|nr:hypothetical protein CSUI_007429 [Cystoisospora suis]
MSPPLQALLDRLEAVKPMCELRKSQRSFAEHEKHMENCSYSARRLRRQAHKFRPPQPRASSASCRSPTPQQATVAKRQRNKSPLATRTPLVSASTRTPDTGPTSARSIGRGPRRLTGSRSVPNLRTRAETIDEDYCPPVSPCRFQWQDYAVYPTAVVMGGKLHQFTDRDLDYRLPPSKKT